MKDYNAILKRIVKVDGFLKYQQLFRYLDAAPDKSPLLDLNGMISAIEHWDAAHTVKTYVQDFFEKFPNAQKCEGDVPFPCLNSVNSDIACPYGRIGWATETCSNLHREEHAKCWNRPMEDKQRD